MTIPMSSLSRTCSSAGRSVVFTRRVALYSRHVVPAGDRSSSRCRVPNGAGFTASSSSSGPIKGAKRSGGNKQVRMFSTGNDAAEVLHTPPSGASSKLHTVTLNRPKKLNSLSLNMIRLLERLYGKRGAAGAIPGNSIVWMEGAGEKAFCAGGDVAALAEALRRGDRTLGGEFFHSEYAVDYRIATQNAAADAKDGSGGNIVTVSVWDKIIMGGGVGLGFHNPIRIVTEKTTFAMPETKIGLFPDVGMTWGLSRLRNQDPLAIARFLGLVGFRLNAADCLNFGIGTHFVEQKDLGLVKAHLDTFSGDANADSVATHLETCGAVAKKGSSVVSVEPTLKEADCSVISRCFGASVDSVAGILGALDAEGAGSFAAKIAATLREMSPLSLQVSFAAIQRHHLEETATLRSALQLEYRMAMNCLRPQPEADFAEGVAALLLDKRSAKWAHERVEQVPSELVDTFFLPVSGETKLGPWAKELEI
ncbi:unnamed protein product [Amoebophrya sp. A25]|nr:unnamed protein product [Amoebophrya sp. A25]|eukprot:GSA25T00005723001.1